MPLDDRPRAPSPDRPELAWTVELATGVPEIDRQHRELFDWLAELESATSDRRMMTSVYALTRLVQYTRSHFATEEALMRACGYPRIDAHMAEHAELCRKLARLQAAAVSEDTSGETISVLRSWLIDHVMGVDMDYVPHVKAHLQNGTQSNN